VSRKKALGADPLSWIKPTVNMDAGNQSSSHAQPSYEETQETQEVEEKKLSLPTTHHKNINLHMPKFQTYEVKLTIRLKEDQLQFLSRLEREIMKNRSAPNKKERITKNSIIRAIIDVFQDLKIDTNEIGDEYVLLRRLKKAVRMQENKITKA
jgi:hypothetical protein